MTMLFTAKEQAEVVRVIKAIDELVRGEDASVVSSALAFYLIALIREIDGLSERGAVEACAKHFKTYSQVGWS